MLRLISVFMCSYHACTRKLTGRSLCLPLVQLTLLILSVLWSVGSVQGQTGLPSTSTTSTTLARIPFNSSIQSSINTPRQVINRGPVGMMSRVLLSMFHLFHLVCRVDADNLHRAKRGTGPARATCVDDDIVDAFNSCGHHLENEDFPPCIRYQNVVPCMLKKVKTYVLCSEKSVRKLLNYPHNSDFLRSAYGVYPPTCEQAAGSHATTTVTPRSPATTTFTTRSPAATIVTPQPPGVHVGNEITNRPEVDPDTASGDPQGGYVDVEASHALPAGFIRAFTFYVKEGKENKPLHMQVFRQQEGRTYKIIAERVVTPTRPGVYTYYLQNPIEVQLGDNIGFTNPNVEGIITYEKVPNTLAYNTIDVPPFPEIDQDVKLMYRQMRKYSFAAVVNAYNDECQSTIHGCEGTCVNINGSYKCECAEGYILGQDGKSCSKGTTSTPTSAATTNPSPQVISEFYTLHSPTLFNVKGVYHSACWDDDSRSNGLLGNAACKFGGGSVSKIRQNQRQVYGYVTCTYPSCRADSIINSAHCKYPHQLITIACPERQTTSRTYTTTTRRRYASTRYRWRRSTTTHSWQYNQRYRTKDDSRQLGTIVGAVFGSILFVVVMVGCCYMIQRSHRRQVDGQPPRTHRGPAVIYTAHPPASRTYLGPSTVFTPFPPAPRAESSSHREPLVSLLLPQVHQLAPRTPTPSVIRTIPSPAHRAEDVPRREPVLSLLSPPSYDEALRFSPPSQHPVHVSEDIDPPPSYQSVINAGGSVTPK